MSDDKIEQGSSIIPFGLLSLSIATFLMGFAAIFQSRTALAPYFTMALLFGGIGEFLAGMWAFAYRESIVATIFSFLGLFYAWFGLTNLVFQAPGVGKMADVDAFSTGMVFLIGGLLTLYLWMVSFHQPSGLKLTLLFLWISFLLLAANFFTNLAIIGIVAGISAIFSSIIAATASFTDLHRQAGLGEVPTVDELAQRARDKLAERVGPVDELARKAREMLADKIRPNGAPRPSDGV
jgi:succinate-acetate transporter protein